mmetsp:Transcript_18021/g.42114  ORF Transcript_18021/g.42114 Transcript_18021/m.42114 type:complete len:157 (-) Transcript_18021:2252-2722(-)
MQTTTAQLSRVKASEARPTSVGRHNVVIILLYTRAVSFTLHATTAEGRQGKASCRLLKRMARRMPRVEASRCEEPTCSSPSAAPHRSLGRGEIPSRRRRKRPTEKLAEPLLLDFVGASTDKCLLTGSLPFEAFLILSQKQLPLLNLAAASPEHSVR